MNNEITKEKGLKDKSKGTYSIRTVKALNEYSDSLLINLYIFSTDTFSQALDKKYTSNASKRTSKFEFSNKGISKEFFKLLNLPFDYDYYISVLNGNASLNSTFKIDMHRSIVEDYLNQKDTPIFVKDQICYLLRELGYEGYQQMDGFSLELIDYDEYFKCLSFSRFFMIKKYLMENNISTDVFFREEEAFPFMELIIKEFATLADYNQFRRLNLRNKEIRNEVDKLSLINIRFFYEAAVKHNYTEEKIKELGNKHFSNFNYERIKTAYRLADSFGGIESLAQYVNLPNMCRSKLGFAFDLRNEVSKRQLFNMIYNGFSNEELFAKLIKNTSEKFTKKEIDLMTINRKEDVFLNFVSLNKDIIINFNHNYLSNNAKTFRTNTLLNYCVDFEFFEKDKVKNIISKEDYIEKAVSIAVSVPYSIN